jgi:pyruvate/2-oxoglutarate dehydrogenase complex dihydrolipoamide acyltransferase (E2) component
MMTRVFVTLSLVATFGASVLAQQGGPRDSPLATARDLYASARYDEALAVLNGIRPTSNDVVTERKWIEQYRSLCLLALGRGSEAEVAIAAVVTADPLFQPTESDASPRVRTAFSDVRQRLLPEIVRTRYNVAKASYDRRDFALAERQFRELVALLEDPQMGGRLGDLRILATGFLDLSTAALAPPPPPPPPAPAPPVEPKREEAPAPVAPAPVSQQPAAPATRPAAKQVYTAEDAGVTVPVIVRQDVPRVQPHILAQARPIGMLEVVIDELGRVTGLTMRSPVHPLYDPLLMAAAREWKYQPATLNGRAVKFRKMIKISVEKR